MMNKTAQTELRRKFLIEGLPEPLTRASAHIQIFDNYIEGTRLRLRSVRDPYKNTWTHTLQQRVTVTGAGAGVIKVSEIHLNEAEYALLETHPAREIRKNRYFHEFDLREIAFDVYLGDLWGLNTASVEFESADQLASYVVPPFAIFEITSDPFFSGEVLVSKTFDEIRSEISRLEPTRSDQPALVIE